jgi:hypothetical protein
MSIDRQRAISSSRIVPQRESRLCSGRDLAGAVLELPRRIGEDRAELPIPRLSEQVNRGGGKGEL